MCSFTGYVYKAKNVVLLALLVRQSCIFTGFDCKAEVYFFVGSVLGEKAKLTSSVFEDKSSSFTDFL